MTDDSQLDPLIRNLYIYGKPGSSYVSDYLYYIGMGFRPKHVPELIRVATEKESFNKSSDDPACWAPLHAWRALAQMKVGAASEPLTKLFHEQSDNEWVFEELPRVFSLIGPPAIPALLKYINDVSHGDDGRSLAIDCLGRIGKLCDGADKEVLPILKDILGKYQENSPFLNASVVLELMNMKAADTWPLIEKALDAKMVDTDITGSANIIQVRLGLKEPTPDMVTEIQPPKAKKTTTPGEELEKKSKSKRRR